MKILSIHDGHNATACYLDNGKVIVLASEERFVNIKNQGGFPVNTVQWILGKYNLSFESFDYIVFPSLIYTHDFSRGYGTSARHRFFNLLNSFIPGYIMGSSKLIYPYIKIFSIFRRRMLINYARQYKFPFTKVVQVEHHQAHGYAALYASGLAQGKTPVLIFTMDDSGDGVSSRVAVWDKQQGYKILSESSSFHSLGNLYANVTRFLGMKAGEDEYKIMGMSPYVSPEKSAKTLAKFKNYIKVDSSGRIINNKSYGPKVLNILVKEFHLVRFDAIAGAIQKFYEIIVQQWICYWARKTGLKKVVFGGGCFMNVKANMFITELDEFDDIFICPSSGDESTALGAAYAIAEKMGEESISLLEHLYKGPIFSNSEALDEIKRYKGKIKYKEFQDIEKKVAELLRDGNIIARFKGPAEWGARALGGRSIICRADDLRIIHKLNKSIKNRDFWMPFAASILSENANRYLINNKNIISPFMMLAFHTTAEAQKDIGAALHPYDFTCRPQFVSKENSPSYYQLLKYFQELTGLSGFLNTSFNLHGYPIVGTPTLAIETLLKSDLDYLAIENILIEKVRS